MAMLINSFCGFHLLLNLRLLHHLSKDNPAKDATVTNVEKLGTGERNCPCISRVDEKEEAPQVAIASGLFTIELYSFLVNLGFMSTGCVPIFVITTQVFQREVENQLGKTIKSLRSDRGGEYMSQEFLDHLKEHGIIAHATHAPPYTPQNNGVSERRNRTL
ncbi:retrotransposon protein, putative, ty1-copia subclass [Tanacetum coccineum]